MSIHWHNFAFLILLHLYIYCKGHKQVLSSEDNLWELALSLHHVGPGIGTQVVGLAASTLAAAPANQP